MTTTLVVQGLEKTYGSGDDAVRAVRNVSFETRPGEFVALVGPSGSGKTTLLAMVGGLLAPTGGRILVNDREVGGTSKRDLARYRREMIGFVFQANNLLPFLTARENLLVPAIRGSTDKKEAGARADRLLEELGLTKRRNALATQLSGGERQRVAIARALMNDPRLVLVDEPTASLDSARGRQVVESLIQEVRSRDVLGIMVTHDMAMAELADRVLEMHDGEIREHRAGKLADQVPK
ncbi:MAG TPA: ABC transporter ATP-binding protein [Tepidiformaceae bacterium]|nr:ABC transporter ATP-binding protein [Tepidiformaceae bacterium]